MRFILAAFAVLSLTAAAAQAADRTVACRLVVKGRAFIDGPCLFSPETDGSFSIGTGADAKSRLAHFAYVFKTGPNTADAFWNEEASDIHAHDPLGKVERSGACWSNATAQICAR